MEEEKEKEQQIHIAKLDEKYPEANPEVPRETPFDATWLGWQCYIFPWSYKSQIIEYGPVRICVCTTLGTTGKGAGGLFENDEKLCHYCLCLVEIQVNVDMCYLGSYFGSWHPLPFRI